MINRNKKVIKNTMAYVIICAMAAGGVVPPTMISYADATQTAGTEALKDLIPQKGKEWDVASDSNADQKDEWEISGGKDEIFEEGWNVASDSNADMEEEPVPIEAVLQLPRSSGTGDLWIDWSGSMDFLSGTQGNGTEENPFQISSKAQLMGLSELTAMGMMVSDGSGSYPGDYSGSFFKLTKNIDLGGMTWMPIGFYNNQAEMTGEVSNVFNGTFDGNGKTISNFKLYQPGWNNVGFFGSLDGAVVRNLKLAPSGNITGSDHVGILCGSMNNTTVFNVTVSGNVKANGAAGGLAGVVTESIIENCSADVTVDSNRLTGSEEIYVGGIAGKAALTTIVDCEVSSGNNGTERIQGKGYVGGITGHQNSTDIYNVSVSGTIGGTESTAIGGITGLYHAGEMKVVRFSGKIGNSGLGSRAHEGTFIGNRNTGDHFVYGEDLAYLFADSETKITAGVCGSDVPDDNDFTYEAHIGFWHGGDLHYTLVQTSKSEPQNDTYFYEELEAGILSVMDNSLNGSGEGFCIDHFAPNKSGNPTRGYLVFVPQIDTVANGNYYTDIASLQVKGSSSYNRVIDKNMRGAVTAGDTVTITTSPNNTGDEKYQIKEAGSSPDRTHNYVTYTDKEGNKKSSNYVNGGVYTFTMPANDTEVTAEYEKVATNVTVTPHEFSFKVKQTRSGNRKTPTLTTTVTDGSGKLIATYINGTLQEAQVQPSYISATVDNNNQVADSRVKWTIDDSDLIQLSRNDDEDADGYTDKRAEIRVNLDGRFFKDILADLEKDQIDGGYRDKIPDTIFGAGHQNGGVAVLTASTRPDTSFEQKVSTDNCRIGVTFQVIDQTYVAGENSVLDKATLDFEIVRTLTGDRKNPVETITVTEPQSLTATFSPDFFSKKDVVWKSDDTGIAKVTFDPGMENQDKSYRYGLVQAVKDARWIKDIMAVDDGIRARDPYAKISGNGSRNVTVTVTADDQLGGKQSAEAAVTVQFRTVDQTRVVPEEVKLSNNQLHFDLSYTKKGDIRSATVGKDGFVAKKLDATVIPVLDTDEIHKPYNNTVTWKSSDPSVAVDGQGNVSPVPDAAWILEAMQTAPYQAEKTVTITATSNDGQKMASCQVTMKFLVNCVEQDRESEVFDITLTATGRRSSPSYSWAGVEEKTIGAAWYPDSLTPLWKSSDEGVLTVSGKGSMKPVIDAPWMKEAMTKYPYKAEKAVVVSARSQDGTIEDTCTVLVRFQYRDYTSSGSGGGGGGGAGGGGGRSSSGVTPGGSTKKAAPAGTIAGTWINTADGKWTFTSGGRTFANEWAYIHNPYAPIGQDADWFRFSETGHLVTGWFKDVDGNLYYMHPISDGRQGYMYRGWNLIDGKWYYFNLKTENGLTNGALFKGGITSDGYRVDENGVWIP